MLVSGSGIPYSSGPPNGFTAWSMIFRTIVNDTHEPDVAVLGHVLVSSVDELGSLFPLL
jgi:hypothetical protein